MNHRVGIGLPTYNRPDLLRASVNSLQAQTYQNIEILISDNASPDPRVMTTIQDLAARDSRIRYVRRSVNEGPAVNFRGVLASSDTPFFMWASDDDIWDKHFIERCLNLLQEHPEAQMAFTGVDNVNLDGVVVRTCSGFSRFTSSGNRRTDALRFVAEPDILGKANLIYGLYRTDAIKAVADMCWDRAGFTLFGGDIVFVFAFISRHPIVAVDDILLHKRIAIVTDEPLRLRDPRTYLIPPQHIASFVRRHRDVAPDPIMASEITRAFGRRLVGQSMLAIRTKDFWKAMAHAGVHRLSRLVRRGTVS